MPVLIVKFEGSVLKKVATNGGSITIGRAPDNAIAIDNLAISNRHAEIKSEQGGLVVEDLNSLNGTFVNNQRVKRSALKHGDVVSIGKHSIQVDETVHGGRRWRTFANHSFTNSRRHSRPRQGADRPGRICAHRKAYGDRQVRDGYYSPPRLVQTENGRSN